MPHIYFLNDNLLCCIDGRYTAKIKNVFILYQYCGIKLDYINTFLVTNIAGCMRIVEFRFDHILAG